MAEHLSSHRTGYITPDEIASSVPEVSEQSDSPASMDPQSTLWTRRAIVPVNRAGRNDAFEICSPSHSIETPGNKDNNEPTLDHSSYVSRPLTYKEDIDSFIHFIRSPRSSNIFEISQFDLRLLNEASQLPPITMAGLNQLEVSNIIGSPRMRHDLNFDKETKVNPNYSTERGRLRRGKARDYWKALEVELALYMECAKKRCDGCLLHNVALPNQVWRMQDVFATLKDILKNLMREEDGSAIEQSLDVRLLMQQLNKGICDLQSLSNWVGRIIKGSCSPIRDGEVNDTVDDLNEAINKASPSKLAQGLERLFTLFETMKLDIANHQLRFLRILMISDSTEYVREHFTNRIRGSTNGEPKISTGQLETARAWYSSAMSQGREDQDSVDADEEEELFPPGSYNIILLGRGIRDLVRCNGVKQEFPVTFEYDLTRLNLLRRDYQQALSSEQVSYVFESALEARGLRAQLYEQSKHSLLFRISQLQTSIVASGDVLHHAVVLEVVRAIYNACGLAGIPSEEDVTSVYNSLRAIIDPSSDSFKDVEKKLCEDLDLLLEKEITEIYDLPPLQISNRYETPYPPPGLYRRPELSNLAARIAHITVLHWQIWAPILYYPLGEDNNPLTADSSREEPHQHSDDEDDQGRESAARPTAPPSHSNSGDQSETESETALQTSAE